MKDFELSYVDILNRISKFGKQDGGRNGETRSLFAQSMSVNMTNDPRFPVLFGRHIHYKQSLGELAAFFRGPQTLVDFELFGCTYWDQWANDDGTINLDYGNKWINFNGVNQIENVSASLKENPNSRRHIVSGWDPATAEETNLPCCHFLYQWYVVEGYLDMIWYQRSVDMMVGLPHDIVLAAAWNILLANECGYKPGRITFFLGDCHIYEEHYEIAEKFVRDSKIVRSYPRYELKAPPGMPICEFTPDMIELIDYDRPKINLRAKA